MARDTLTKRVWQNAGAPVDGGSGTFAAHEWLEKGDLLIDTTNATLYQNTNTQASPTWTQITSGGVTLDSAYDFGGAGVGKAITVDSGAVALTNNAADNNGVLTLEKTPVGAQSGNVLTITVGANATGAGIAFANTGTGNDITGSAGWSIQADGDATFLALTLAEATNPAGTIAYISRDNVGDVTINALTGKEVHIAIAGTDVLDIGTGVEVISGGLTVTAGGLTIAASGATITGNVVLNNDLTVSGSLTFGGNWTVAATLTVDELILDTDGSAPAGTNCYAVRDNAGDLTLNAITGKQVIVAINNTDEFTFSATILDFNGNAADNVGFLILNAATAPDATEVYLVNDNTGDLTLNALTGKDVIVAINGVDEVKFDDAAHIFNDAGNDRDFRVESNSLQYAVAVDGGKDCIVLGDNTDISSADVMVIVGNVAKTASNNASTAIFKVVATASFTGQGTNAVMASAWFDEPNLTAGGATITDAATVYISGEPTEGGTGNYGLMCAGSIGMIADAKDLVIGAGRDVLIRWSTGDADNHALAIGLGASLAAHICQNTDIATDWNVAAASNPTLYIHGATSPATEYVALSTDETDAHLNAVGANWSVEIGGTPELTISASAVNLAANTLQGGTADSGDLVLQSTSHGTKGFITLATGEPGIVVGGTGASVDRVTNDGTNAIHLFNGVAPVGAMTNGVTLYSSGGEFYAMDAAGNATLNSAHTPDGDAILWSYGARKDQSVRIHIEKLLLRIASKFPGEFDDLIETVPGIEHSWEMTAKGRGRFSR